MVVDITGVYLHIIRYAAQHTKFKKSNFSVNQERPLYMRMSKPRRPALV
jgi:hypothetical protein